MTVWLKKLAKILALGFETGAGPEQQSALAIAKQLAANNEVSLGSAYRGIAAFLPAEYEYLEAKRRQAGVAPFAGDAARSDDAWNRLAAQFSGDSLAALAMKSCTVHPLVRRRRG